MAELEAYDWDQKTVKEGMVSKAQAEEFRKTGKPPESWCGWTNNPDSETIRWEIKYRDHVTEFLNETSSASLRRAGMDSPGWPQGHSWPRNWATPQ